MSREYPVSPATLIKLFSDAGYTPQRIEELLRGRVSYRALYRWKNEEAQPQRQADYTAVYDLAVALKLIKGAPLSDGGMLGESEVSDFAEVSDSVN
jgi:hypothetical protein